MIDTRKPAMLEVALDCIQKLISFKLLQGPVHSINHRRDAASSEDAATAATVSQQQQQDEHGDELSVAPAAVDFDSLPPQVQAVELLCCCDDVNDEAVELRLLKALLTAVTSPALAVHGQALLLAVRACYNVFLTSRSEVNQTTAKATLTQMLNAVFQRMEAGSASVLVPPLHVSDVLGLPPADASSMSAFVQQFLHDVAVSVDVLGYHAAEVQQGLDDAFVHSAHDAQADPVSAGSTASSQPSQQLLAVAMEADGTRCMQQEQQQMAADAGRDAQQQLDKDAFLVFRALCKLSIRNNDGGPSSELTTVRGKVLALELLKILLENSGPRFASGERFVAAIRQYLCLSLLKNCASPVPALARLCCSIFLTLMAKFRRHLKAEVGVFFPMILLRPIEPAGGAGGLPSRCKCTSGRNNTLRCFDLFSGPSCHTTGHTSSLLAVDTAHKAVVLRCLQAQCEDGQLLVDLFVNYDCDLESANMFERAVTALVRIAQGTTPHDATAQAALEEAALRYEALRCLVSILRSLVAWHVNSVNAAAAAAAATAAQAQVAAASAGEEVLEDSLHSGWMERMASHGVVPEAAAGGSGADAEQQQQAAMLESFKAYKRQVQEGVRLFNQKPRKGVAFLLEQGLFEGSGGPDTVAAFLARTPGLNKALIGDYLGERDDFCIRVMHAYVDAIEFGGLLFDEAIRWALCRLMPATLTASMCLATVVGCQQLNFQAR